MSSAALQFGRIQHPRVLVLGDPILDRYTFGDAERVSPEAPVLVLLADRQETQLGGAASVAFLLRALDAKVTLAGVIGDDSAGRMLKKLLADASIDRQLIRVDPNRTTTSKERFLAGGPGRHGPGGHQIVRVDHELRAPIGRDDEDWLAAEIAARLPDHDVLLISDYAKGVCTPHLMQTVIAQAHKRGVPVVVDPARSADYDRYRRATLIKPNRAEAELAWGHKIATPQDALFAGKALCRKYELGAVLVTLDQQGMALFEDEDSQTVCPTEPREVFDVTGAGDMVLATLGICLGSNIGLVDAARIANMAAGLEVERLGVAPISRDELARALLPCETVTAAGGTGDLLGPGAPAPKLISEAQAAGLAESYRALGKTVVFTNGCFDLLHVGHLAVLRAAAAMGDILIVAVNDDASVRAIKGADRPVIPAQQRASLLAALDCVGHVFVFPGPTPLAAIRKIRPDVLVKGPTTAEIVGREIVEAYGGRVLRAASHAPDVSTTGILSRVRHMSPPAASLQGMEPLTCESDTQR